MNIMNVIKRSFAILLILSALALYAVGAGSNGNCPLPIYDESAATTENAQSPEQPACKRKVFHNGMVICLPCPAADAHVRVHGDADMGPCDKPGNETPPGQS